VHRPDEAADVVADNLQQHLIGLSGFGLRAQTVPELGLNHGKGGFGVRAQVVVRSKRIAVELVEVPQLAPQS
jgi:hypothetical protein